MGKLMKGDCLERLKDIPDNSVDLILTDPPYGTTQNKWDAVIPFERLWPELRRVRKKRAAVVMTASQPFSSALVMSNAEEFGYEWVWEKPKATGHLNAKIQPLRAHENILVFYRNRPIYTPQKTAGAPYAGRGGGSNLDNYGAFGDRREGSSDGSRYPRSVLRVQHEVAPVHPTQKPVALMEYLIRTYTDEGATVLDFTMGSGTTGVACVNTKRDFIGIEMDDKYFAIAVERIKEAKEAC